MQKLLSALITLLILISPAMAGGQDSLKTLVDLPTNPVFAPEGGVDYTCVVSDASWFGGNGESCLYKMWYSNYDSAQERNVLRYASSDDGINWREGDSNILGELFPGENDRPIVLYDEDRFGEADGPLYKLWYWTGAENANSIGAIHYAGSEDGIHWYGDRAIEQNSLFPLVRGSYESGNPSYGDLKVDSGDPGDWFYHLQGPGYIIYNENGGNLGSETPLKRYDDEPLSYRYVMYYDSSSEGPSPDGSKRQIALAYSTDGLFWIRQGNQPVIVPGGDSSDWDGLYAYRSSVLMLNGLYHMWYAGANGEEAGDNDAQGIGHGTSPDGINWVLDDTPLAHVQDNESWRISRTGAPWVIAENNLPKQAVSGDDYKLWAVGEDISGDSAIGYWETAAEERDALPGVEDLLPSGTGTMTDWTPYGESSNWECARTNDGDVSYVHSITEWLTDRYQMDDLTVSGVRIDSVVMHAYARKAVRPSLKIYLGIRSGGVDDLARASLGDAYAEYTVEWTADPATGQPWTINAVNAIETVVNREANHGREARVTQTYLKVYYTEITTPTPAATPTAQPTATPTAQPTETPSPPPTATPAPTFTPTPPPTIPPTPPPTIPPTPQPTATPTAEPTATPTAEPTATPPAEPTVTPTAEPTATPTAEPTATPAIEPTATAGETTPSPTPFNIAEGKDAFASSQWSSTYGAANVTDNSFTEETIDYWLLSSGTNGWIQVDLGDPYFLDEIRWLNTHNGSHNDRAATSWRIEVSTDGVIFTEIDSGTEEFSETPSWVIIPCDPEISYRYIKLTVDGYHGSGGGINEIAAAGILDNPGAPNQALDKPVTASDSWSSTYGPGNVTDGSYFEDGADYWLLPSYTDGWIEVDLEKIYDLTNLRWLNTHNDGSNDRATTDWRIEISIDGETYTEIGNGTEAFSETPIWAYVPSVTYQTPVTARYIRFYVDGYYWLGGGVNEIEAYGQETNIALNGTATASGAWSEAFSADRVIDGLVVEDGTTDYWLLPSYTNGWVQVELDASYELNQVLWLNTHNDGSNDRAATDWRMAISEDGVEFVEIGSGTESFSETPQWISMTDIESGSVARYVRLYVDDYFWRGGGANEIEIFADLKILSANLALGKPAIASDSWSSAYGPDNVTDGKTSEQETDYWLLPSYTTGWVEVDLEADTPLSEIRWLNTHNDGANDRAATDWRLEVSSDGIEYTEVGIGSESFSLTPSWVVTPLSDVSARYVRLYVDGYYNRGGGINELAVFGSE
jgi:F5/8 type C domain